MFLLFLLFLNNKKIIMAPGHGKGKLNILFDIYVYSFKILTGYLYLGEDLASSNFGRFVR